MLFPPFYHLPGTNKSAEEQCKEEGYTAFTHVGLNNYLLIITNTIYLILKLIFKIVVAGFFYRMYMYLRN